MKNSLTLLALSSAIAVTLGTMSVYSSAEAAKGGKVKEKCPRRHYCLNLVPA